MITSRKLVTSIPPSSKLARTLFTVILQKIKSRYFASEIFKEFDINVDIDIGYNHYITHIFFSVFFPLDLRNRKREHKTTY